MYREQIDPQRGKLSDTATVLLCLVVIFVFEPAMVLSGFPQTVKTIGQSVLVALLVYFCIWFYRKRLRSVRYTLITDNSKKFNELEELPKSYKDLEIGTFLAETIVGMGEGNFLAAVSPSEMREFYGRGESVVIPKGASVINATLGKKENACALLYEQDGRQFVLYISPSEELENELSTLIKLRGNNNQESEQSDE